MLSSSSDEDQSLEEFEHKAMMANAKSSFISSRSGATENELSTNSDDLYVTANDSSFSSVNNSPKLIVYSADGKRNKPPTRRLTIRRRHESVMIERDESSHQQQQQQHCQQHVANKEQQLLRDKKKRASTSSCSSSDSYVSYGSGYASGSGNSSEPEHKQRGLVRSEPNSESPLGEIVLDEDNKLEERLSQLEQLTDELTNCNILANENYDDEEPRQSTSKNFFSTIKSTVSNSSSQFSTESNSSSASSNISTTSSKSAEAQLKGTKNGDEMGYRSFSTTPTKDNQTIDSTSNSHLEQCQTRPSVAEISKRIESHAKALKTNHQHEKPNGNSAKQPITHQHSKPLNISPKAIPKQEPFHQNLFQWEQLVSKGVTRPLLINDLDFTDLRDEDDCELLYNNNSKMTNNSSRVQSGPNEPLTIDVQSTNQDRASDLSKNIIAPPPMPPPPISPWFNNIFSSQSQLTPSPNNCDQTNMNMTCNDVLSPQTSTPTKDNIPHLEPVEQDKFDKLQPTTSLRAASSMSSLLFGSSSGGKNTNKRKTMKLFWKEVREDRSLLSKLTRKRTIWDEIKPVHVDTQRLEHLFESKAKDLLLSKSRNGLDGLAQRKVKITVLDAKRSNAINIGMTKLPPMRTIKSAILKMDSSIMNREGIEKILTTMMPSEEEKSRIIEAQLANPDTPLGTAEQFLLNLASISALEARLKLWAFQLDYAQIEKEVAEPLMDLKQAIEEIERSETFRNILGTLLAIGNFLNSTNAKGFQIDYLEKVPEVKDTVHKHSLLHHLCLFMQEKYDPELAHDLYSEFSAVNRASKVDYAEVAKSLKKMQQDCKSSWDYLKIVAKHDGLANLMNTSSSSSSSSANTNSSLGGGSTANSSSNSSSDRAGNADDALAVGSPLKSSGKLNNLSKLSMITTVVSSDGSSLAPAGGGGGGGGGEQQAGCTTNNNASNSGSGVVATKQLKTKVSDFLTDCAERIMVLVVIHRRVMNRFQKLLVYLGCPSHQIKQTQPQQILKVINEFALEYRTKRERVREMLAKKRQQCHHHHHQNNFSNRWQLNRTRWAGSQQCIADSMAGGSVAGMHPNGFRPCSTTSSCASSYAPLAGGGGTGNNSCADSICGMSMASGCDTPQQQSSHHYNGNSGLAHGNRAASPSGFSQISNYSDYQFDQSSGSRQQSVTPVPAGDQQQQVERISFVGGQQHHHQRRPHSMSVSMFDLQNQQHHSNQQQQQQFACGQSHTNANNKQCVAGGAAGCGLEFEQRQKDEQLRRLLGAGKSLDESCNELFQMSHWSTTMARVTRHPPAFHGQAGGNKQRAASVDQQQQGSNHSDNNGGAQNDNSDAQSNDECRADVTRQSSYYKYLHHHNGQYIEGNNNENQQQQQDENSDEEILRSLVRTATAKSSHHHHHHHHQAKHASANHFRSTTASGQTAKSPLLTNNNNTTTSNNNSSTNNNKSARNRILSRINCDRKSIRRTLRTGGIELSNVG